ncbi:MAG TPA: hypothetical protein VE174_07645 [Actinomycetota bacterium]|nr:hypothetical protein [Actinomycetota bacterium]
MNELHMVAASDIWTGVHLMIAWSLALALVGLVAIGWSFTDGPAATWARFALASAIAGVTVAFITVLIDGPAMKHVAENLMANHGPETMAAGTAVTEVSFALFTGTIGSLFGLTPVLFGVTVLNDDSQPKGLGYLAVAAGALGLLTGSIQYVRGITNLTANILFPVASFGFIVWLFIMGWRLWKGERPPANRATD